MAERRIHTERPPNRSSELISVETEPMVTVPGPTVAETRPKNRPKLKMLFEFAVTALHDLAVLIFFLIFPLAPGVPGEGPDCHFPKGIIGSGAIPAQILKMFNCYFGPKHSSVLGWTCGRIFQFEFWWPNGESTRNGLRIVLPS